MSRKREVSTGTYTLPVPLPENTSHAHVRAKTDELIELLGFVPEQVLYVNLFPQHAIVTTMVLDDNGRPLVDPLDKVAVRRQFKVSYDQEN